MNKRLKIYFLIFNVICFIQISWAVIKPCTKTEAIEAEGEVSNLQNWDALFKSFKKYGHCDTGAIAEGYTESIARIFTNKWNSIIRLNQLTSKDSDFENFILNHIDETIPLEQWDTIHKNSSRKCPKSCQSFCNKIKAKQLEIQKGFKSTF